MSLCPCALITSITILFNILFHSIKHFFCDSIGKHSDVLLAFGRKPQNLARGIFSMSQDQTDIF